jgi:hypothetical protein
VSTLTIDATVEKLVADLRADQSRITLGKNHRYKVDGKHMPNVTTIIRVMDAPQLDAWKVRVQVEGTAKAAHANPPVFGEEREKYVERLVVLGAKEYEHERLSQEAADTGKQVHALIEWAVKDMLGEPIPRPEVPDEALFIFAGWRGWASRVGFKPLMAEVRLANRAEGYCGTADLLALVKGQLSVVDWKVKGTDTIYPEVRLQSAAYRMALRSCGWPELDGYVVRLPKDGGDIHMENLGDPVQDWEAFLACLRIYRWRKVA